MNTDARSAGLAPYALSAVSLHLEGGEGRGAWPGEVAATKLEQGEMPILHTPLLLSLCELELIQTQMTQKPMLRVEVGARALRNPVVMA